MNTDTATGVSVLAACVVFIAILLAYAAYRGMRRATARWDVPAWMDDEVDDAAWDELLFDRSES